MNIVDFIILFFIVIFAILGIKRGVIHSAVSFVGTVLVVVLAFIFKNYISILMYENLPFFKFNGIFKNITVINIALYEFLAFLIILIVLFIVLKILIKISKLIEKVLKFTIILSIPSKIAGFILGALEGFFISFVFLYLLALPIFNIKELKTSKYGEIILNDTPVLSKLVENTYEIYHTFETFTDEYEVSKDANKYNLNILDLFLKHNIISVESADKLVERGKLDIPGIEEVLNRYREGYVEEKNDDIEENQEDQIEEDINENMEENINENMEENQEEENEDIEQE